MKKTGTVEPGGSMDWNQEDQKDQESKHICQFWISISKYAFDQVWSVILNVEGFRVNKWKKGTFHICATNESMTDRQALVHCSQSSKMPLSRWIRSILGDSWQLPTCQPWCDWLTKVKRNDHPKFTPRVTGWIVSTISIASEACGWLYIQSQREKMREVYNTHTSLITPNNNIAGVATGYWCNLVKLKLLWNMSGVLFSSSFESFNHSASKCGSW